jgi:uncharacterized Ntn-hydrolase superfamily protein
VAYDRESGDLGVAVQSKFIAVGAVVPWAKANVGAVATQARSNVTYGARALKMLEEGTRPSDAVSKLISDDEQRDVRQFAIVDANGRAAAHTGKECMEWAGHVTGDGFSCQGNILAGKDVVRSMAKAYEETSGDLIEKLFAALTAGQKAGGDRRGQQSAAILVVREKGGYEGFSDRYVDLRVDDSPQPIEELRRVFNVFDVTMLSREPSANLMPINGIVAKDIQSYLRQLGLYSGPVNGTFNDSTKTALQDFVNMNNFENRMHREGYIWKSILEFMKTSAQSKAVVM